MTDAVARFRVGDRVRAEREAPSRGTWPRYAGRVGTVIRINRRDGEIGVRFGAPIKDPSHASSGGLIWFLPSELINL